MVTFATLRDPVYRWAAARAYAAGYLVDFFAARTGAKRSEMIRVVFADADLFAKSLTITENAFWKTSATRSVPLSPVLYGMLKNWLTASWEFFYSATEQPLDSQPKLEEVHASKSSRWCYFFQVNIHCGCLRHVRSAHHGG